ncbi:MAG: 2,3-bisphosphoglycerate-dependent phosphoglycerate mutase [Acidimicrobiaceae bacterium]|jgi:probable phosphoglycerate mutase
MDLLLIRHALPVRRELDEGEVADPPLAEQGHAQAAALAEWLVDDAIDVLYASPMRRAMETAQHVADRVGLPIVVDPELAEFDRQSHFYIPIEELKAEKDERWDDLVAGRWGNDGEVDPRTFQAVVVEAVERVIDANAGKTVAIIAHGGVMNAYLSHVIGTRDVMFFEPAYTCISRVVAARTGQRMLRTINEHAHVRGLL